ncbi:LysR family transcriptional regulator [Bordetella sp. N]|uniref:LysR family transcriptional regulator n=1 Tax=Bordetella sp. N TaxID=1746199 RepID=UPI00070FABBB|nr:LysR substrate-binding domain-containing protein [Bordetella sp. N]ALM83551.1 LysR family transcriptional regulator [Bordetella sp. N]
MNLRHLEVFHAIMQAGSVTGAAHLLNVTQPAISNVLRHAEQQLRFKLFERIGGRLQPTPEASDLFPDVEAIFGRIDTLNRAVDEIRGGRSGRLVIAASPTFVNAYLPEAVSRLHAHSPGGRVTILALATATAIEERVARREADIGMVYTPVMDPSVGVEHVGKSNVVCAVPRRSKLARRKEVRAEDLAGTVVVATGPTTRTGMAIQAAFGARGLAMPSVAVEVNSSQAACLMVAKGVGIGLVDLATVHQYALPDVVFRPFWPLVELNLCLIFPKDRPRSRLAVRFAKGLREQFLGR